MRPPELGPTDSTVHPASLAPHPVLPVLPIIDDLSSHGLFWPCPLKTLNTKGVMLATPCPVLHEASAVWLSPLQSSWLYGLLLSPVPRNHGKHNSAGLEGGGGLHRPGCPGCMSCLPTCTLQSPAPQDPRIRGAALPVSRTKHKGVPCLARSCPTERPFLP